MGCSGWTDIDSRRLGLQSPALPDLIMSFGFIGGVSDGSSIGDPALRDVGEVSKSGSSSTTRETSCAPVGGVSTTTLVVDMSELRRGSKELLTSPPA